MNTADVDAALAAAAFGGEPGAWPLPAAATPRQHWLRAVAAGGQGRYASARADLAAMRGVPGPLASLAHSTQASFLRQLGGHEAARGWDGRAAALAGADAEAAADALVGLAADALGVGRFAASAALLARANRVSGTGRQAVRCAWVSAELAMLTGDGATARRYAETACELAEIGASLRHRVKSDVVLAGALCCVGDIDRARAVADAALDTTGRLGLVPLRWALACLLGDIGSATGDAGTLRAIRDDCAALIRHRGGGWRIRNIGDGGADD